MNDSASAPTWKKVLGGILDFLTVFVGGGYLIALMTGHTTDGGSELSSGPALAAFAAFAIVCFVLMPRFSGTISQRILRTK